MAWFEAHDSLPRHPKTLELSRLLKLNQYEAIGLLWLLFDWGLIAAEKDGRLPKMQAFHIARALDWPDKKADMLTEALVSSGFLDCLPDGEYAIHNWYDYAGKLMDKREADRKRKEEIRRKSS